MQSLDLKEGSIITLNYRYWVLLVILYRPQRKAPFVLFGGVDAVLWKGFVSPAVMAGYAVLFHVNTYLYEVAEYDVVFVRLFPEEVFGGFKLFGIVRSDVPPLVVGVRFFAIEIFD